MLEVLGEPRPVTGRLPHDGDGEGEQHTGDGGVHAGLVNQHPGGRCERQQQGPLSQRMCVGAPRTATSAASTVTV